MLRMNVPVFGQPGTHHIALLVFTKALGPHRGVRHVPEDENTENDGGNGVAEEQPLPGSKGTVFYEREAVCQQTSDDLLHSVHHVPVSDGSSLLLTLVPHCRKHNKGGLARGFEDTKQGSDDDQASEVFASSMTSQADTPGHDSGIC